MYCHYKKRVIYQVPKLKHFKVQDTIPSLKSCTMPRKDNSDRASKATRSPTTYLNIPYRFSSTSELSANEEGEKFKYYGYSFRKSYVRINYFPSYKRSQTTQELVT